MNRSELIGKVESTGMREEALPDFRAGDTVNVSVRVVEGEKTRIQNFQGIVISRRSSGG